MFETHGDACSPAATSSLAGVIELDALAVRTVSQLGHGQ
jgi:aminoglycoside phosphotransferase